MILLQSESINRNRIEIIDLLSIGAFSGIAGCTPSTASQCATTDVSSGALGNGASIICSKGKHQGQVSESERVKYHHTNTDTD
jgi:hypothetical protein